MKVNFKNTIINVLKNRILQHILFWLLSLLVLTNVLKVSAEIKEIDIIYAAIFQLPLALLVYFNLRILFPLFLEKRKIIAFVIAVLATVAASSVFYYILFNYLVDFLFPGYYFIAYYNFFDISLFFAVYLLITGLLHLARGWFRLQEIEKEKTRTELSSLHAQINPHFLFNSLNSIYSLSRKNSPDVPGKIVQLSDLLRHMIYECDAEFIPLEKEIEMIRNYIELQNLRTPETEKITLQIEGEFKGKMIAPFIFLPFVENSFKHGLKSGAENAFVAISVKVSENSLRFEVVNPIGDSPEPRETRYKGVGIENVRKRLNLLYAGDYSLDIQEKRKMYNVFLNIKLK